jgi:hypothetical protein
VYRRSQPVQPGTNSTPLPAAPVAGLCDRQNSVTLRTLTLALIVTVPFFVIVLIVAFRVFDRLLRIQFSDARSDWERAGCPSGYFWSPPGSRKLSLRARGYLYTQWFYHAPLWASGSQQARNLYVQFKLMTWLLSISLVPVFIAIVLLIVCAVRVTLLKLTGIDFLHQ